MVGSIGEAVIECNRSMGTIYRASRDRGVRYFVSGFALEFAVACRAMEFWSVFYLVAACGLVIAGARIDYRERRSRRRVVANLVANAVLLGLFVTWLWPELRVGPSPLVMLAFVFAAVWEVVGTVEEYRGASPRRAVSNGGPSRGAVVAATVFYLPVVVLAGVAAFSG